LALDFSKAIQHAFCRFSAACEQAECKLTLKTKLICLLRNPSKFTLQVSGNPLQQVEKLKDLGVVFTSDGGLNNEIDTRFGKVNAVLRKLYALWLQNRSFQNLSAFNLAYGS